MLVFGFRTDVGSAIARQSAESTVLSLGEASASPGEPIVVPLTLSPAESVDVGTVEVRLTYPTAVLSFVKSEPSGLALGTDATLEAEVTAASDAKSSVLHVSVSAASGSGKPLPAGPLTYLTFKVSAEAKPETPIAMMVTATAFTAGTPRRAVEPLVAPNPKITVAAPPVTACFFYMH